MEPNFKVVTIVGIVGVCVMMGTAIRAEDFAEFRSEELRCIIGDNAAMDEHRAGYNGVFRLTSVHQDETLFVPDYAGLNLEHVFDGSNAYKDRDVLFEPRRAPMEFRKIDERTAELYQPALPFWKVESTTRFRLTGPNAIDVTFSCTPKEDLFQGGAMGIFWASYINAPMDKSIYYLQGGSTPYTPKWMQFCTQYHNHDSTVRCQTDMFQWRFVPDAPESLFTRVSQVPYAVPFYYGRFRNMVWIVVFAKAEGIRFAHSPSGGGSTKAGDDTNPAWDFQFIVPDPQVDETYTMRYRAIYTPWIDRQDVLNVVKQYWEEMGG